MVFNYANARIDLRQPILCGIFAHEYRFLLNFGSRFIYITGSQLFYLTEW